MNNLSPVAIFVYNRLDNTRRTIEHLQDNLLAGETDVYIFSDGPRANDSRSLKGVREIRQYLHSLESGHRFRSLTIVERPENIYLERNIIEGIDQVFESSERVIVLEDDILTSPHFLEYMNEALDVYRDDERIMHVSGFTNLDILGEHPELMGDDETYFTPHMAGWGWATWRDKWRQHFVHFKNSQEALEGVGEQIQNDIEYGGVFPCLKSLDKDPIPWDVCWELAIYKAGGLCLTPVHTLVRNIGLANGTHFRSFSILQHFNYDREPVMRKIVLRKNDNPQMNPEIEALFAEAIRDWGIRYTWLGKIVRWVYKKVLRR